LKFLARKRSEFFYKNERFSNKVFSFDRSPRLRWCSSVR